MRNKKNLKSPPTKIYLNVDVTPLRSIILFSLRRDATIKYAQSVKEKKVIVYNWNDSEMVLKTVYDIQRAFPKLSKKL